MIEPKNVVLFLLPIFVGCADLAGPTPPLPATPAFAVDTLEVTAKVRVDTSGGSPATYFTMKLVYHFEWKPGSLFGLSLSTSHLSFVVNLEPYTPTPTGTKALMQPEFRDPSTFPGQDSLFVSIGFGGSFWERTGGGIESYGSFSVKDSMWIHIQR
jgi:hypothetical protein